MTTTYVDAAAAPVERTGAIKLHGPEGFEGMRKAGRLAADMLDRLAPHVVPGARTADLDAIVYQMAQERSEERRVGQACVRTCRSRWMPDNEKNKSMRK